MLSSDRFVKHFLDIAIVSDCLIWNQDLESITISSISSKLSTESQDILKHITSTTGSSKVQDVAVSSILTKANDILSSTTSLQFSTTQFNTQTSSSGFQDENLLSSRLSSTEPSLLPSMPTSDSDSSNLSSFLINFAFITLFVLVSVFVLIQCSHFILYIARQTFKNRNSGSRLSYNLI